MNAAGPESRHASLARDIHRIVRSIPDRPAPATLEARVLAAVAAPRAAAASRGFEHWSSARRGIFFAAALGFAAASVRLLVPLPIAEAWTALGNAFGQLAHWGAVLAETADALRSVVAGALPEWLRVWGQLVLLCFGALYVVMLAAGAAAWRWWQTERALR